MIAARVELEDYTNKVLNVIKAKYGLLDKSQALNKFALMYGEEFVEFEPKDEYIKKAIAIKDNYLKKYGKKKMSIEELDRLCEVV